MSGGVWKAVETSAGEFRIGETERGRSKRGSRKKERRKEEEEKTEEGENHRNKKNSRRVGDMGRGRRSGKVRGGSEEVSTGEVSQVDKGVWEEAIGEDAYKKIVGSRDRRKGGIHTKERKGVPTVKRGERRSKRIYEETTEEGLHSAVEVTTNGTSIFCGEKGWEEEDGARLQISQ